MKKKEITKLGKQLLQYIPGFFLKGNMLIMPPVGPILRGIVLDDSGFNKTSFTLTAFVLPLCIPTDYLYLNFGNRIRKPGGGDRWDIAEAELIAQLGAQLRAQAVPFLSRAASLLDFVEIARTFSQTNPNTQRAIAYSLARAGRSDEALELLDRLLDQLDRTVSWQSDLANEATELRVLLRANPKEASRQLKVWEYKTMQNLGLGDIADDPLIFPGKDGQG